jgi:hypothetical protein
VSSVQPRSLVLNGTVNPNGQSVSYDFVWGTAPAALTNVTPVAALVSGTTAQPVSAQLSGLAAASTYYYELQATGGGVTRDGSVLSAQTATPAPAVTLKAKTVSGATVQLHGTVDPSGFAVSYTFEYGRTATYGQSTASISLPASTGARAVSASLGKLSPRTTYHYALVATGAGGTVISGDGTFKAPPPPAPAPAFAFSVERGQTVKSVLRHGIAVGVSCEAACTVAFTALRSAGAGSSAASPVYLARGQVKLAKAGGRRIEVAITSAARKLLRRGGTYRLSIDATASSTAGISGAPQEHGLTLG